MKRQMRSLTVMNADDDRSSRRQRSIKSTGDGYRSNNNSDNEGGGPVGGRAYGDDDDDDYSPHSSKSLLTHQVLSQMLSLTLTMHVWRAKLFFLVNAGNLLPIQSLDLGCPTAKSVILLFLVSKLINWIFTAAIIVSVVVLCLASEPSMPLSAHATLFFFDLLCTAIFSIEILMSALSLRRPKRRRHVFAAIQTWVHRLGLSSSGRWLSRWIDRRAAIEASADEHEFPDWGTGAGRASTSIETGLLSWRWVALDAVATLPFYAEVTIAVWEAAKDGTGLNGVVDKIYGWDHVNTAMRVFRALRILRLFKIVQKSEKLRFMLKAVSMSVDGIWLLFYMIVLVVVLFSSILFFVEQTGERFVNGGWYYVADDARSPFQSIVDCFWITMVTLTTTGYGDVAPKSAGGKLVMTVVMIISLFIIAFPLSMITLQYGEVIDLFVMRKESHERARRMARARMQTAQDREDDKAAAAALGRRGKLRPRSKRKMAISWFKSGSAVSDRSSKAEEEEVETKNGAVETGPDGITELVVAERDSGHTYNADDGHHADAADDRGWALATSDHSTARTSNVEEDKLGSTQSAGEHADKVPDAKEADALHSEAAEADAVVEDVATTTTAQDIPSPHDNNDLDGSELSPPATSPTPFIRLQSVARLFNHHRTSPHSDDTASTIVVGGTPPPDERRHSLSPLSAAGGPSRHLPLLPLQRVSTSPSLPVSRLSSVFASSSSSSSSGAAPVASRASPIPIPRRADGGATPSPPPLAAQYLSSSAGAASRSSLPLPPSLPAGSGLGSLQQHPSHPTIREVERSAGLKLGGDGFPARVIIRAGDWRSDDGRSKADEMLKLRIDCRDEKTYRRLMKVLAEV
ncbi:hypothetical protein DFJ73DRAFT_792056 [Zopfochytrium polystomum]|nr:hypothetical protein DFJ73DRAFT_792056 [Zopfochytrium polystomum]